MELSHTPGSLQEVVELLRCRPGHIVVDGTIGGGGHACEILKRVLPGGYLIGIDRDPNALKAAEIKLAEFRNHFTLVHSNYIEMEQVLKELGIAEVDGILMDLGVSSHQLDDKERGFSYMQDAPLDMRMDPTKSFRAYNVVNEYSQGE